MFANPSSRSRARKGSKMSELPEHPKMQDIRTSKNCPLLTCFVHFDLIMHFSPQRRVIFRHQNFKKCSENDSFFNIFTSKCASRHSGMQFCDIRTSKSSPKMTCFVHFHFKMRFSPQRRAILRNLNFKKWSEHDVFCTFSLQNVLLVTAACNFSSVCGTATSAPAALTGLLFD